MISFLLHPAVTFVCGALVALAAVILFLTSCNGPNDSAQIVKDYREAMQKAGTSGPAPGTAEEKAALSTFTNFLKNLKNSDYIEKETANAYAEGAFLDDTIVTHHGPEEIKKYFLATAATMTDYQLKILDTARSGPDHYIRWEMIFAAPKLANGEPIHSIGITQVRFNSKGKVAFHQDFWDSGKNIYGKISIVGGLINSIRKRMQ